MVKVRGKKKWYDEQADWVPAKGRQFVMKANRGTTEADAVPERKAEPTVPKERKKSTTTDAEGLSNAYASSSNLFLDPQGTLHVSGTKGGLLGSEWIENYITMGVPLVENMLGGSAKYRVQDNERYREIDDFVKAHPGEVKNMVAHSKGAAAVDVWMRDHPEWTGKARLYGTPYEDVLGKEKWKDRLNTFNLVRNAEYEADPWKNPAEKWLEDKVVEKGTSLLGLDKVKGMRERNEKRIAGYGDPVAALDSSAQVIYDPDWWKKPFLGFGHDYHTIAAGFAGFDGDGSGLNQTDRPGEIDPNYRGGDADVAEDNTVKDIPQ